jgi:hypothetical protein
MPQFELVSRGVRHPFSGLEQAPHPVWHVGWHTLIVPFTLQLEAVECRFGDPLVPNKHCRPHAPQFDVPWTTSQPSFAPLQLSRLLLQVGTHVPPPLHVTLDVPVVLQGLHPPQCASLPAPVVAVSQPFVGFESQLACEESQVGAQVPPALQVVLVVPAVEQVVLQPPQLFTAPDPVVAVSQPFGAFMSHDAWVASQLGMQAPPLQLLVPPTS